MQKYVFACLNTSFLLEVNFSYLSSKGNTDVLESVGQFPFYMSGKIFQNILTLETEINERIDVELNLSN